MVVLLMVNRCYLSETSGMSGLVGVIPGHKVWYV
jgi:hypothetical protein